MFNFAWGDSLAVREVLLEESGLLFSLPRKSILEMGYPETPGLPELVELTKILTKEEYLGDFKYISIVAGAHHGMATILRAFRDEFNSTARINTKYFSFYPKLLEKENYKIIKSPALGLGKGLNIVDSPSNPEGNLSMGSAFVKNNILWDAVYNNRIFNKNREINPNKAARFFLGSFSKFLGINGIRLGWIGCNTLEDYEKINTEIVNDTLGISVPSQLLVIDILKTINIDSFTSRAARKLDSNRETMSKLEKYMQIPVPANGMFYLGYMDVPFKKLLKKAQVSYIDGNECGAPGMIRLNLAQSNELTEKMVKAIITADTIK